MRVGWALAGVLVVLTATATLAQAAPGTIAVRAELPLEVTGTHEARGDDARYLVEGADGDVQLTLVGQAGAATRVVHRMWGYVNTMDPQFGVVWDEAVERDPLPLAGATLTMLERRPEFRLLASDGDLALSGSGEADGLLVGALDAPKVVDQELANTFLLHLPPNDDGRYEAVLPAGTLQARSTDGLLSSDGPVTVFITDAIVAYQGPTSARPILAHFREESRPGTLYNPLTHGWSGPGTHTEYIQEYLLVEAQAARLTIANRGVPASLYTDQSQLAIDGTLHLPAADGTVTVTDEDGATRHELRGDDLDVGGRFTVRAHDVLANPARTQVDGDGEITTVTYDGVAAHYDWSKAAAAAGLGALALAALAWLAFHAKAVASAAGSLLAGYARVSGQEVLEHPGRAEVYERVKAYPGVSFAQLSDAVGFGQSTLNYHLRVLEKNEYIASVKDGRYLRFFDRQAGTYAGHRKHAVSALRNSTSAAIARHIKANPGVVQRDLAAAFGVTASTVSWHIHRLAGAGLVTSARDAHFTRYYLAEGWGQLPAEEAKRQAVAPLLATV